MTARAIPVVIFNASPAERLVHLRKWCQDPSLRSTNIRDIIVCFDNKSSRTHRFMLILRRTGTTISNDSVPASKSSSPSQPLCKRSTIRYVMTTDDEARTRYCSRIVSQVPRVAHPDWLEKRLKEKRNPQKQAVRIPLPLSEQRKRIFFFPITVLSP